MRTAGRKTRSTPCHDVGAMCSFLSFVAAALVEGTRCCGEVAVIAAGDEECRALQLLHGCERVGGAEERRRGKLDDTAHRRANYWRGGDDARAAHRRAGKHDLLRASAAQLGRGRDHVKVRIAVRDPGGSAIAPHVEDERPVALLREVPGEGQPLATVGAGRVRQHDAGGAPAEHRALEPRSARSLEGDVGRAIRRTDAAGALRRLSRAGRGHEQPQRGEEEHARDHARIMPTACRTSAPAASLAPAPSSAA